MQQTILVMCGFFFIGSSIWQTCPGNKPLCMMFGSQQIQFCQSLQKGWNYKTGQSITVLFQICISHLTIDICLIRKIPTYFKPNEILNSLKLFTNYFFVQSPCFLVVFFQKERKKVWKQISKNFFFLIIIISHHLPSSTKVVLW